MPAETASQARLRRAREEREAARSAVGPAVSSAGVPGRPVVGAAGDAAPSSPPPLPAPAIVDAPSMLPRDAAAALVRCADGRMRIDAPFRTAVGGRRRRDVHCAYTLPGVGVQLVAAMFKRSVGRSDHCWVGYSVGASRLAPAIRGLGLADTGPAEMPADLFAQVEEWWRTKLGVAVLPDATRGALNAARWLVGAVPGCAHVDVWPDPYFEKDRPQWEMSEGLPAPVAETVWGDAETERFVKRCSEEILATVAAWNQLVGFVGDGAVGAGPRTRPELTVAAAMVVADPTFPPDWRELARRPEVGTAMYEVGRVVVAAWAAREVAGAVLPPAERNTVAVLRQVDAGNMKWRRIGDGWRGLHGIVRAGWHACVAIAYPTLDGLAPFTALLAIQSRLNVEPLLTLADAEFGIVDGEAEVADGEGGSDDPHPGQRIRGAPYKGRSHRPYPVDFPVTLEADDPAPLIDFVSAWTAGVRERAGRYHWTKFLYVGDLWHSGVVTSFAKGDAKSFPLGLERLCARAGVPRITPRELRRIGIDLIHEACDGDPVTMLAAGDWRELRTGQRHYFGPAIVMRGQESLGWSLKIEQRRLDRGIDVMARPRGADLFSATDGFRCRNPLGGPDRQEPGELCHARGQCALCIDGELDVADPAWSCAQAFALADHIATRLAADPTPTWIARNAPVLDELLEFWLPYFPDEVVAEAARLPLIDYPELPE